MYLYVLYQQGPSCHFSGKIRGSWHGEKFHKIGWSSASQMAASIKNWGPILGSYLRVLLCGPILRSCLRVLLGGPYMRDPVILDPYFVPLIFGNSHIIAFSTFAVLDVGSRVQPCRPLSLYWAPQVWGRHQLSLWRHQLFYCSHTSCNLCS